VRETDVPVVMLPDRMTVWAAMGLQVIHQIETATQVRDWPPRKVDRSTDATHGLA